MPIIKPKFDGKNEEGAGYNGPPPVPGPYHGVVKKMWFAKIKSGNNAGEDQYKILIEIDQGKYKGAGLFHNIQMLNQNAWSTNQFLDAMCVNEKQRDTLRGFFWDIGCDVATDSDKVGQLVNFIGKPKFNPVGKALSFIVKNEPDNQGGTRAVIDRFVVQIDGGSEEPAAETATGEEDTSGLEEFEQETSSNPEPEPQESAPPVDEGDDDDPWS